MFGYSFPLLRIFGFEVRVDPSWFIIALLVTWSLATGLFPALQPGLPPSSYWAMGAIGAAGLFASIVLHELSHSLTARRLGVQIRSITLFIFGGVAEMAEEPRSAKEEFLVAIAGPLASIGIAFACLAADVVSTAAGIPPQVVLVLRYLWWVNLLLVVFNLVPAFPLDGGRVLRSILWRFKGDLNWATRITSSLGAGFGIALIALGVVNVIRGQLIGGLWWVLIGMFLRAAAAGSYRQLLARNALQGQSIDRFMSRHVHTVPADITLSDLVEKHVYRHHHTLFPVVMQDRLVGCVSLRDIQNVPRDQWSFQTVADVAEPCGDDNTIAPHAEASEALNRMSRSGRSKLMVVQDHHLQGILSLKDLLRFMSLKMELEGTQPQRRRAA